MSGNASTHDCTIGRCSWASVRQDGIPTTISDGEAASASDAVRVCEPSVKLAGDVWLPSLGSAMINVLSTIIPALPELGVCPSTARGSFDDSVVPAIPRVSSPIAMISCEPTEMTIGLLFAAC